MSLYTVRLLRRASNGAQADTGNDDHVEDDVFDLDATQQLQEGDFPFADFTQPAPRPHRAIRYGIQGFDGQYISQLCFCWIGQTT